MHHVAMEEIACYASKTVNTLHILLYVSLFIMLRKPKEVIMDPFGNYNRKCRGGVPTTL